MYLDSGHRVYVSPNCCNVKNPVNFCVAPRMVRECCLIVSTLFFEADNPLTADCMPSARATSSNGYLDK